MNELDVAERRSLMAPEAVAERKRLQDALRRLAKRYEQHPRMEQAELTIRRAIEELFEAPMRAPFKVGE